MSDYTDLGYAFWNGRATRTPACVAGYDCSPGDCDCEPKVATSTLGNGQDKPRMMCLCDPDTDAVCDRDCP